MKKHDEGYVLVYVTVVLLIFCLVAAVLLTGAMRNLNYQQESIQQMKDQYEAAGQIEQVLANWDTWKSSLVQDKPVGTTDVNWQKVEDGYDLIAARGNVQITCRIDKDGNCLSYRVDTIEVPAETDPLGNGGGTQ